MKNAFLPMVLSLAVATTSTAQDARGFKLGIKAAPNVGWIKSSTKQLKSNGHALGFSFGLMGDFRLSNDNYALSTGIQLNLVGADQVSDAYQTTIGSAITTVPTLVFARRYQYIEVPLLVKLKTNELGYMTYFGQMGFGSGFCVSATSDVYTYSAQGGFAREEKVKALSGTFPFRASLVVGIGAEYKFAGNTTLVFGINYNNSFTDNFSDETLFTTDGAEVKDRIEAHGKLHFAELLLGVYF